MRLRRRVARLEARPGARTEAAEAASRRRLFDELLRIERFVIATGDASDNPRASPMERAVRRWVRGDATIKDALADLAAGRWPERNARTATTESCGGLP